MNWFGGTLTIYFRDGSFLRQEGVTFPEGARTMLATNEFRDIATYTYEPYSLCSGTYTKGDLC